MTLDASAPEASQMSVAYAAGIVSAYVRNNTLALDELPELIRSVHAALVDVARGVVTEAEPPKPAVPIKKSVFRDHIICLEDGLKFKSLKRHLKSKYDLTPEEYRARWGLPADYPMVAPGYSEKRSKLAKKMGLGRASRDN
jgi:predicted transcriptional regulator